MKHLKPQATHDFLQALTHRDSQKLAGIEVTRSILSVIIMTLEDKAVFSRRNPSISPGPQTSSYTYKQMLFSKLAGEAAATEEGMFPYQHSALSPHPGPPHSCFHVNPAPKWKVISQHWNVNAFIKSDAESEENFTTPRKGFSV